MAILSKRLSALSGEPQAVQGVLASSMANVQMYKTVALKINSTRIHVPGDILCLDNLMSDVTWSSLNSVKLKGLGFL